MTQWNFSNLERPFNVIEFGIIVWVAPVDATNIEQFVLTFGKDISIDRMVEFIGGHTMYHHVEQSHSSYQVTLRELTKLHLVRPVTLSPN